MSIFHRGNADQPFRRPSNPGVKITALAAFLGVLLNGVISGVGYLVVAGYLNYYKINIAEAELPLSSYLFYGYLYLLDRWNVLSGAGWLAVTFFILILTYLIWFSLKNYYPVRSASKNILIAYALGSLLCIAPALPIVTAYNHGKETAHWEMKSDFKGFGVGASKTTKTYYLEGGEILVGWSLFTAAKVSWIVVDNSVYKISNFEREILFRIDYDQVSLPSQVINAENELWRIIAGRADEYVYIKNSFR